MARTGHWSVLASFFPLYVAQASLLTEPVHPPLRSGRSPDRATSPGCGLLREPWPCYNASLSAAQRIVVAA